MNPPKCDELDHINFLIAVQKVFSNTEAAKCHPAADNDGPAHVAYTRLLHRCQSDAEALWQEVKQCVSLVGGILVVDDSTLDKFYARQIQLVTRHWSGKHHRVVQGINLISLLWTDGEAHLPCDFRVYDKPHDRLSKNNHFQAMLVTAAGRGFQPRLVGFDSWYASLKNLKLVRTLQWHWLTQLKANRLVDPEGTGNRSIREVLIPRFPYRRAVCLKKETRIVRSDDFSRLCGKSDSSRYYKREFLSSHGLTVHLKGYGLIKVFKVAAPDGRIEYWATSDLTMTLEQCADNALPMWRIEEYHRGLKQFCGIERAQHRSAKAQRNHIGLALRAFLRLEVHRLRTGVSWFEAKTAIVREVVCAYLAQPLYTQTSTA